MPADPTVIPNPVDTTLFGALLAAARAHGWKRPTLEDQERKPLSFRRLVAGTIVLGRKLAQGTRRGEAIGLLLPNANAMVLALMGLNAQSRVAALINVTAGERNIASALRTAVIGRVVTSRRFVEEARLGDLVAALTAIEATGGRKVEIVYLEDVRRTIGTLDTAIGAIGSIWPRLFTDVRKARSDQPAVILFTSGTEGAPKGVVLSNANLLANSRQIIMHAAGAIHPGDTMLNPLPMFHAYGLTAGTLMPLFNGLKVVLYPSPLHYRQVPRMIAATKATVLVATDTFLQGYGRAADPADLATVKFVVAGAERVRPATRELWQKAGTVILEGYGATECSPVLACNLPTDNRPGTVGPLLPGIEHRLETVEGITQGGRLMVKGANVMLGYMLPDMPGVAMPPPGGWHDTGDIVEIGGDGFVSIRGRAKRFAKIGGEMVSLAAIEALASGVWPDANHVAVSLPDPRKGEQIALVTTAPAADREALLRQAQAKGMPELWVPRDVLIVEALPVLGSGKIDVAATLEMVRRLRPLL